MKTVVMLDDRPISPSAKHVKGQTYTIADDLADYYLSIGVARFSTIQQSEIVVSRSDDDGSVQSAGFPGDESSGPVIYKRNLLTGQDEIYLNGQPFAVGGGSASIPFSTSVPFTTSGSMGTYRITGAVQFTPNTTGAVAGSSVFVRLVANGTNAPTFSGFAEANGSSTYSNTDTHVNLMEFFYDGVTCWRSNSTGISAVIDTSDFVAPTFVSASINETSYSITFSEALAGAVSASEITFVGAGGVTQTASTATQSGSTITGTVLTAAANGNTVTVSGSFAGLTDAAGNPAVAFAAQSVTNTTPGAAGAATPLALSGVTLMTEPSAGIYLGNASITSWTAYGRSSPLALAQNTAGFIEIAAPALESVLMGFVTVSGGTAATLMTAQVQIAAATTKIKVGTGTAAGSTTDLEDAMTGAGVYYRLVRAVDGTITVQRSVDSKATWTVRHTFAAPYTGSLWAQFHTIAGARIYNPAQGGME